MAYADEVMLQHLTRRNPLGGIQLKHFLHHGHKHQGVMDFCNFIRSIIRIDDPDLKHE